ncbi:hypothetical protein CEXT_139351 [Caerostris extrusa]|uniref:Uncharacterized protein n=1 Tax=Caerostris extrusa TaxID=172846 RepID=A0AAV4TKS6_CAEEX|nr:hypothetical protein CEXT_139351 [Caerostris extrusa]
MNGGPRVFIEWVLYGTSSVGCLLSMLWIAGGIPIEEHKLKRTLEKEMNLSILVEDNYEKPTFQKLNLQKSDFFVFTGWNIISYRRSSIFALFEH